jgi:hypothetical protein
MTAPPKPLRAHLVAGGFPRHSSAGHDIDFVRLRLLELLREGDRAITSVASDFADIESWLPRTDLLITYVAGPYLDDDQAEAVGTWLEGGGRWLALHGTSGGKAVPPADGRPGRIVSRSRHHEVLGSAFLNHPPIRRFRVDVRDHSLTRGLPDSFEVEDELYLIELLAPDQSDVLLTTSSLPADDPAPRDFGFTYGEDTSVRSDGHTRALAYLREYGKGAVAYIGLGHCHTPATNIQPWVHESVDPKGKTPLVFQGPWKSEAFLRLLRNGIAWGTGPTGT